MNSNNSEQNDVLSQGSVSVVSAARPTERSIYRVGTQDRGATGPRRGGAGLREISSHCSEWHTIYNLHMFISGVFCLMSSRLGRAGPRARGWAAVPELL